MKALVIALERFSLARKLTLGVIALLAIATGLAVQGYLGQRELIANTKSLYETELLGVSSAKGVQLHYAIMGRALRQAILAPDEAGRSQALAELATHRHQASRGLQELLARVSNERDKRNIALFQQAFDGVRARNRGVRLIGVAVTNLGVAAEVDLFESAERRRRRELTAAVDKVREKYGFSAVTPGAILRARRRRD